MISIRVAKAGVAPPVEPPMVLMGDSVMEAVAVMVAVEVAATAAEGAVIDG
jgi:hypothetical protein